MTHQKYLQVIKLILLRKKKDIKQEKILVDEKLENERVKYGVRFRKLEMNTSPNELPQKQKMRK